MHFYSSVRVKVGVTVDIMNQALLPELVDGVGSFLVVALAVTVTLHRHTLTCLCLSCVRYHVCKELG